MESGEPLDVVVVGAGVYATGRGTTGYGTILPALLEGRRRRLVGRITIAATRQVSLEEARQRAAVLGGLMKVDGTVHGRLAGADLATALAKERPLAAIVSVPDAAHANAAVPLLERGIPCLVVKPFATTLRDAQLMCQAAERGRAYGAVEFHKRWDAANVRLREEIQAERLGIPLYAVVEFSQQKRVPLEHFRKWAHETNVFQYLGVHYVDLLVYATGYRPEAVVACGQRAYLAQQGVATEDAVQVMIRWKTSTGVPFVSTHLTHWVDPNRSSSVSDQRITVVGTLGHYQSDQKNRGIRMVTDERGIEDLNPYFSSLSYDPSLGALRCWGYGPESIMAFLNDVSDLKAGRRTMAELDAVRPSFASALVSTAVIEAAGESLKRDGAWVQVSEAGA